MQAHVKKIQAAIIYTFIAACIIFLFVGIGFRKSQELKDLWNVGHFILFAFIAYPSLIRQTLNHYKLTIRLLIIVSASIIIAGSVEFVQKFLDRDVSISDIYISVMGAITSLFIFTRISFRGKLLLIACLVIIGNIQFSLTVARFAYSKLSFPVTLALSENNKPSHMFGRANKKYQESNQSIHVTFNTDVYSNIGFKNIIADWSQHEKLKITLNSLNTTTFRTTFRVVDREHELNGLDYTDRFSQRIYIKPGLQTIYINIKDIKSAPASRDMDIKNITEFMIITSYLSKEFEVIIHDISLE